jgi:hypothetical protein
LFGHNVPAITAFCNGKSTTGAKLPRHRLANESPEERLLLE